MIVSPHSTPKQDDLPLSAVCDRLFSVIAATSYIWSLSSIRNLRTRHAVVIRDTLVIDYFTKCVLMGAGVPQSV
jgi:hypothetical protein